MKNKKLSNNANRKPSLLLPCPINGTGLDPRHRPEAPKFVHLKEDEIAQKETDRNIFLEQMRQTVGSADPDFFTVLITQASNSIADAQTDPVKAANFSAAFIHGLKAKDQTEGILIAQMAGTHNLIMEFMRRAIIKDQYLDAAEKYTYRACKLMNLFIRQIEALEKYRGKSTQQKVIVEHVNVGEGGKAIVGNTGNSLSGGRDGHEE